jgi:hypothetical protein
MRHVVRSNDWTTILNALNALAAASSRQPSSGEQSAVRTAESWVERISKEKWTAQKGLAIASAVVGVGAILYGARTLMVRGRPEGRTR